MAKDKKQEVKDETLPVKTDPVERHIPAVYSADDMQSMYGDMEGEDVSIPRLVLIQSTSPEFDEKLAQPGDFFIKGQARNLGGKELEIIPLIHTKSRIRWRPLGDGGGQLCSSQDGKTGLGEPGGDCKTCKFANWTGNKGPECDLYQNLICVIKDDAEWTPIALSGSRTKLKPMKDLNSLLMVERSKGRPLFAKSYVIRPVEKQNKVGKKYYSFRIVPGNNNQVLSTELQQQAAQLFMSLRGKTLNIQQENEKATPEGTDESDGKF